ncbi:MAG: PspA/IM30 family protein [Bryobacteraceae bacterium]|nr:PspA/IM30 family protein [Bryobacteraceae bacterium]
MGVLERVGRLVRANLNDLIDRAEDPHKLLKQVILDMENQLMQVKTQVAITVSDQHLLIKKGKENRDLEGDFLRRAETALAKDREDLARGAAEKALQHRRMSEGFEQQVQDQRIWVEHLKSALRELEAKLVEARHQADLLIARQRRARAVARATQARETGSAESGIRRMHDKVLVEESMAEARAELASGDTAGAELLKLERSEAVETILREIRTRRRPT